MVLREFMVLVRLGLGIIRAGSMVCFKFFELCVFMLVRLRSYLLGWAYTVFTFILKEFIRVSLRSRFLE